MLAWLACAVFALGQGSQLPKYTVATLPSAISQPHYIVQVIDGASSADCTTGGGTQNVLCTPLAGVWSPVAGTGGGTPGGSTTQVQYNNAGTFAANANLTTNGAGNLTAAGTVAAGTTTPTTIGSSGVLLNGVPALQSQTSLNNYYSGGAGNLTGTGSSNTANGFEAIYSNSTGNYNTANGMYALFSNTTGSFNTANGFRALNANTTGSYNTANGFEALNANTTGTSNTANGYAALYANTTGSSNTANGFEALNANTTGTSNTANGMYALNANTTGTSNTANGMYALNANTTGNNNTANGFQAGEHIADGVTANQTSSNSVYEGFQAYPLASGDTNENVIGNTAIGHGSNTTTLGNSSVTDTYIAGTVHGAIFKGSQPVSFAVGTNSGTGATVSCVSGYNCTLTSGTVVVTTGTGVININVVVTTSPAPSIFSNCVATIHDVYNDPPGVSHGGSALMPNTTEPNGALGYQTSVVSQFVVTYVCGY
jgi:hypothetical protein